MSHPELAPGSSGSSKVYFPRLEQRIDTLRARADWRIACDPKRHEFVMGWACIERGVLHYVYTRLALRGGHVASRLLAGLERPIPVTHWTTDAERIDQENPGLIVYRPSLLRGA